MPFLGYHWLLKHIDHNILLALLGGGDVGADVVADEVRVFPIPEGF